jgi:hypothetical protein
MAKHNLYKHAPVYAPNAVPSPAGWRDHRTNELLVAIRLNMSDFGGAVVVEETVVEQAEVVTEQVEATPTPVEQTEEATPAPVEQTEEVTEAELETEAADVEQTEEVTDQPAKQTKTKNSKK